MHIKCIFLISLISFSLNIFARPRGVTLDYELRNAKFIGRVVINKYDGKGKIYFRSLEFKDTIQNAIVNHFEKNGSKLYKKDSVHLTGFWPYKGDTVLIVIDSIYNVSLFAKLIDNNYRFWSPWGGSSNMALFRFYPPAVPLSDKYSLGKQGDYDTCWDGCLLASNQLNIYCQKKR